MSHVHSSCIKAWDVPGIARIVLYDHGKASTADENCFVLKSFCKGWGKICCQVRDILPLLSSHDQDFFRLGMLCQSVNPLVFELHLELWNTQQQSLAASLYRCVFMDHESQKDSWKYKAPKCLASRTGCWMSALFSWGIQGIIRFGSTRLANWYFINIIEL